MPSLAPSAYGLAVRSVCHVVFMCGFRGFISSSCAVCKDFRPVCKHWVRASVRIRGFYLGRGVRARSSEWGGVSSGDLILNYKHYKVMSSCYRQQTR